MRKSTHSHSVVPQIIWKLKAQHTSLDQCVPPASPRSPLLSATSQTGTSFQTAATANSWAIPVLTSWCARKQRGSISAHQGYLDLNVTYHYGIKTISYVNMQFYVLIISKGSSANTLPWALCHCSLFPPVTTGGCLQRCPQQCRPQKPCEIPLGAGRALERSSAAGACTGTLQPPTRCSFRHECFVVASQPGPRQAACQGLLLSCHKNVTRKQPHTPSPVIFSSHLFSSVSERCLQKALLKTLTTAGQLRKCQHF